MRTLWSVGIGAVLLTGCGGAKEIPDITKPDTEEETLIDYSKLTRTPVTDQALILAETAQLERHIKNGLRLQLESFNYSPPYFPVLPGSSSSGGSAGSGSSASSSGAGSSSSSSSGAAAGDGFTDTNVHVVGIDEADEAKYDGKYWFVRTYPQYTDYFPVSTPGIQIAATDPAAASLEVLSHISLDAEWVYQDGMYLVRDADTTTHLAVIGRMPVYGYYGSGPQPGWTSTPSSSSSGSPVALTLTEAASTSSSSSSSSSSSTTSSGRPFVPWYQPANGKTRIQLIDVQTPASPAVAWDVQLDGEIIDSRRIDDTLYLITRYQPWLDGLTPDFHDPELRQSNESALASVDVAELMPHYRIGDTRQPLSTECYLQSGVSEQMGLSSLIHVTAIDLKNRRLIGSECVNSDIAHISLWPESLYLTGSTWSGTGTQNTVIHRFSIDDTGAHYTATGSVPGVIGFNSDPAFRLHDHNGDLRIVTSDWTFGPEHRLFILSESEGALEVIASLPNSSEPAPIGKPNEDIYAVRFEENRAFIVTFQRTDPLYAIDLSDRLAPKIAGELEVPGFATYMHPLNDRYLFTLGRHADQFGTQQGIKAELMDVSESNPRSVGSLIFGSDWTNSDALHNLRALSLLKVDDDQWRIAFPINQYDRGQEQQNGLQLLEISGLAGADAQLTDAGLLVAESNAGYYHLDRASSRGIVHGDAVFFAHKNAFWAGPWDAPEQAIGPLAHALKACPDEPVNGLEVQVDLTAGGGLDNACDAVVTATDGEFSEQLQPRGQGSVCWFSGVADRPGTYVLETNFPGFSKSLRKLRVGQNRCQVVPETAYLYLTPSAQCEEFAVPAISVGIDVPGEDPTLDVCSATVEAIHQGERHILEPRPEVIDAAPVGFCGFSGLNGVSGEMTLEVRLDGFEPYAETGILVQEENCYVITEGRNISLQPAL